MTVTQRPLPATSTAPAIAPDARGVYHPGSEAEVCALVAHARAHGIQLRVVGADRSVPESVHTDAFLAGGTSGAVELSLDRMRACRFDEQRREVSVQPGCSISRDPRSHSGGRPVTEGLCWQLDQRGWALPLLTGGNVQTVGGYVSSGSDGGSLTHSITDSVVGLRLVDGRGNVHVLRREDGDDLFWAAGVSMGLLGVLTEVTFRCVPRFDIAGWEQTLPASDPALGLSKGDPQAVLDLLRDSPYARVMWWPQPGVDRAIVWRARPLRDEERLGATDSDGSVSRRPYEEMPSIMGSTVPLQAAGGLALAALANARPALQRVVGKNRAGRWVMRRAQGVARKHVKHHLINAFVAAPATERRYFRDSWWQGLAMDAQVDERLMPVHFTELWIPWSRAEEALRRLRAHFAEGYDSAGSFITELYAGRRSPMWMSPAHGEDQLRINVFWLKHNIEDPTAAFFPKFWALLDDLGFRLHWGKQLARSKYLGRTWMAERYPKLEAFLSLRQTLDPDQLFVSEHWRRQLGVALPPVRPISPTPPDGVSADLPDPGPRPWPLLFELQPFHEGERLAELIENVTVIEAPIEAVYAAATRPERGTEWIAHYQGIDWLTTPHHEGSASVETFSFMSIRVRTVLAQPPHRWIASVDACSLPMVEAMGQEFRLARLPGGATELRWRIHYTPAPAFRWAHPLLRPFFLHMFWRSTRDLQRMLEHKSARHAP